MIRHLLHGCRNRLLTPKSNIFFSLPKVNSCRRNLSSIIDNPEYLKMATTENSLEFLQHSDKIDIDRELLKAALMGHGENLKFCPFEYRNDIELVMLAVQNNRFEIALEFASEEMKDNEQVVEESMKGVPSSFRFASERIRNQKEFALKAISYLPSNIFYLSERLQNDWDIIEKTLELDGELILSLQFRREEMMQNKEILLKILKSCSLYCRRCIFRYLKSTDSALLKDQVVLQNFVLPKILTDGWNVKNIDTGKEDVKMVVETGNLKIDGPLILKQLELFKYAPLEIRSDIELVKKFVSKRGELLEFVDEPLKDDYNVVLRAVCSTYNALRFASERLKNNQAICLAAMKANPKQFIHVSDSIKSNREFILDLLDDCGNIFLFRGDYFGSIFEYMDDKLKSDLSFVKEVFGKNINSIVKYISNIDGELFERILQSCSLHYIPKSVNIQAYRGKIVEYLSKYPYRYSDVVSHFPDDRELALKFIELSPNCFRKLSYRLQNDPEIAGIVFSGTGFIHFKEDMDRGLIIKKLKENAYSLWSLPEKYHQDREIVLNAVKKGGSIAITKYFREDREIVMEALNNTNFDLSSISSNLRKDKEIVMKAIENNSYNFCYADKVFRSDKEFIMKLFDNPKFALHSPCISSLDIKLRDDNEIASMFLKRCPSHFVYLSERLRNDPSIAIPLILDNPYLLPHSPLFSQDKKLKLQIVENGYFFHLFTEFHEDLDILRVFFSKYPKEAAEFCQHYNSEEWTKHKDLVALVLAHYPDAYYKASKEIQNDPEIIRLYNKSRKCLVLLQ
ncbi:predicted protein [Naegleria gruberi]|uniref:Predicted protein n=1 Tax=Naegleria gruberi TaxID=5762 RepID=D2VAY0_NAEGR|nr:uncharacterized protein NAEGRDRAFT_66017 [Naegleria gruberi]EFC46027.1 predicted protein [Naegleria gruberi]|eukprot:XP_002678771.1 predicted protein [Naegleria gruberi strain NEG-M]